MQNCDAYVSLLDPRFGLTGLLSQDAERGFLDCLNYAQGKPVFMPPGQFRFDRPLPTLTVPVNLTSNGANGCGPGPASIANSYCAQIYQNFDGDNLITVVSRYPSTFKGFQVNKDPSLRPGKGGSAIYLTAEDGATQEGSIIDGVGCSNIHTPIHINKPSHPRIQNCYFDKWVGAAIYLDTVNGTEGAGGWIEKNKFAGDVTPGTPQGPSIYTEVGYINISRNGIGGANAGITVAVKNFDAGSVKINWNEIEDNLGYAIHLLALDGSELNMLDIEHNEFSNNEFAAGMTGHIVIDQVNDDLGNARQWVKVVSIRLNKFRSKLPSNAKYIWAQAGKMVSISHNQIWDFGAANPQGIAVYGIQSSSGLAAPIDVLYNQLYGISSANQYLINPSLGARLVA